MQEIQETGETEDQQQLDDLPPLIVSPFPSRLDILTGDITHAFRQTPLPLTFSIFLPSHLSSSSVSLSPLSVSIFSTLITTRYPLSSLITYVDDLSITVSTSLTDSPSPDSYSTNSTPLEPTSPSPS